MLEVGHKHGLAGMSTKTEDIDISTCLIRSPMPGDNLIGTSKVRIPHQNNVSGGFLFIQITSGRIYCLFVRGMRVMS